MSSSPIKGKPTYYFGPQEGEGNMGPFFETKKKINKTRKRKDKTEDNREKEKLSINFEKPPFCTKVLTLPFSFV